MSWKIFHIVTYLKLFQNFGFPKREPGDQRDIPEGFRKFHLHRLKRSRWIHGKGGASCHGDAPSGEQHEPKPRPVLWTCPLWHTHLLESGAAKQRDERRRPEGLIGGADGKLCPH